MEANTEAYKYTPLCTRYLVQGPSPKTKGQKQDATEEPDKHEVTGSNRNLQQKQQKQQKTPKQKGAAGINLQRRCCLLLPLYDWQLGIVNWNS